MRWQDIVISVCQICFVIALIPSIRSHHKPAYATSLMNAILVSVVTFCLFSLGLWFSGITAAMVGVTWAVLAIQKLEIDKKAKEK